MKRIVAFFLLATLALSSSALAAGDSRTVVGADLTEKQLAAVYESLGVNRGSVAELTMTNAMERKYLEGIAPEAQLGTKSISCVFISTDANGLSVTTTNIDWCSEAMYMSAAATAGIQDAEIRVSAPFAVSGTSALAGIYLAYEDMTGQALSEDAKSSGAQELVTTGELSDALGSEAALSLISDLKLIADETRSMDKTQLIEKIDELAKANGVNLTDAQREKLVSLSRQLEKLDAETLMENVQKVRSALERMDEIKEKTVGFWGAVTSFFASVGDFFGWIGSLFA